MPERPNLPLEVQADIEHSRESLIKKLLPELNLLFDQSTATPISSIHRAIQKPASLKLQLQQFASALFDLEASRYPQHAQTVDRLKQWLDALAFLIEAEVVEELKPFTAIHQFHCPSAEERSDTIRRVLGERTDFWMDSVNKTFKVNLFQGKIEPFIPRRKTEPPRIVGSRTMGNATAVPIRAGNENSTETLPPTSLANERWDRRSQVDDFLKRCNAVSLNSKVLRRHIWLSVGHSKPRQFEYWQSGSAKTTAEDERNFQRIMQTVPEEFVDLLRKKRILA